MFARLKPPFLYSVQFSGEHDETYHEDNEDKDPEKVFPPPTLNRYTCPVLPVARV